MMVTKSRSLVGPSAAVLCVLVAACSSPPVTGTQDGGVVFQLHDGGEFFEDGGLFFQDGGIVSQVQDGGEVFEDGGVLVQDGGFYFQDGGLFVQDGGIVTQDGGFFFQDGGFIIQDGGVVTQDGGSFFQDGGFLTQDGGFVYEDGGLVFEDGGIVFEDGGALCISGATCTPSSGICNLGSVTCTNNVATCSDEGHSPAGNGCGSGMVCDGLGDCIPTPSLPSAPTDLVAVAGNDEVTLTWAAPGISGSSTISGYTVTSTPGGFTATTTGALTATISGLTNGTSYTFTVFATNGGGNGPASSPSTPVTPEPAASMLPGAPTTVTAVAGDGQATVNWTAPSNTSGSAIISYTVTASTGGESATVTSGTTATVMGLTDGTVYTFTVFATNANGNGPASSPSNAVTPESAPTVPGVPTGVVALSGNASASLSWMAPDDDGGSPITGYVVTASPGGATESTNGATSLVFPDLTNGSSYTFTIQAINLVGTGAASAPSNSVTPSGVPAAPTDAVATAANGGANVTWVAPTDDGSSAITGYTVTASPGGATAVVGVATTATVPGLTDGTSYTFTVFATNANGNGPSSAPSNAVIPATVPGAPTNVVATGGDGQVVITWGAPASDGDSAILTYTVTSSDGTKTATVPGLTATLTGLTNGTAYTFSVYATNAQGNGPAATSNSVTPVATLTISIVSGNNQTGYIDQALQPVTVSLVNVSSVAAANVTVTITSPAGAAAVPATVTTNTTGQATFVPVLGLQAGSYSFTVAAPNATSQTVSATATNPPNGTVFAAVNVAHGSGNSPLPAAATQALVGNVAGFYRNTNGNLYFTDTASCYVRMLSPQGVLTNIAGNGTCGFGGDDGQALSALLSSPFDVTEDETNQILYIADYYNARIRAVNLTTGVISTFAGGASPAAPAPGYGDSGPATAATLSSPNHVTFHDGLVIFSDASIGRIRAVNTTTGTINNWLSAASPGTIAASFCGNGSFGGGQVVFDSDGSAWISGLFAGTGFNTVNAPGCSWNTFGVAKLASNGTLSAIAGTGAGQSTNGTWAAMYSFQNPPYIAIDPAGNVYFAETQRNKITWMDSGSGEMHTLSGNGTAGYLGDYAVDSGSVEYYNPTAILIDPYENLIVADESNYAMRILWGVGSMTPLVSTLSIAGENNQTTTVDQVPTNDFEVLLEDSNSAPLAGYTIQWTVVDAGGGLYAATSVTDLNGHATVLPRAGLTAGPYRFQASFSSPGNGPVSGSPVQFTLNATAATNGEIFTIVNQSHGSGNTLLTGNTGVMATVGAVGGFYQTADGSIYFTDTSSCEVRKLTPQGVLSVIAGTGSCGLNGDNGLAINAELNTPQDVTVDEGSQVLYIADYSNARIRSVNLATGVIKTFAGGATPAAPAPGYGDSGPATAATLSSPNHVTFYGGQVIFSDASIGRIRVVDTATGLINNWMSQTTSTLNAAFCNVGSFGGGQVLFDSQGNAWISGLFAGDGFNTANAPGCSWNTYGVAKLQPDGTLVPIVGSAPSYTCGSETCTATNTPGTPANSYLFANPPFIALDNTGTLYMSETQNNRVMVVSGGTIVNLYSGTGTAGYSGDLVPVASAQFDEAQEIGFLQGNRFTVADTGNYSLRMEWEPNNAVPPMACQHTTDCTGSQTCVNGICVCQSESDAELCLANNANCGFLTATDSCGAVRTVDSCGFCSTPDTCGGAGTANECSCPAASTCGSSCVDLANDANNCGACGIVCGGSTCSSGRCESLQLANGLYFPGKVAVTTDYLFYTDGTGTTNTLPKDQLDGNPTPFAINISGAFTAVGTNLYYLTGTTGDYTINSIDENGTTSTPIVSGLNSNVWTIANDTIYYTSNPTGCTCFDALQHGNQTCSAVGEVPSGCSSPCACTGLGSISSISLTGTNEATLAMGIKGPVTGLTANSARLMADICNQASGGTGEGVGGEMYELPVTGTSLLPIGATDSNPWCGIDGQTPMIVDNKYVYWNSTIGNPTGTGEWWREQATSGSQTQIGNNDVPSEYEFDGTALFALEYTNVVEWGAGTSPSSAVTLYGSGTWFDQDKHFVYVTDSANGVIMRFEK